MTYDSINVGHIPVHKLRKAAKTGHLHLTKEELGGSTHKIFVHPMSHKHLMKHKGKSGTKIIFSHDELHHNLHHGGSIFSTIGDFLKKNGTNILNGIEGAANAILGPEAVPFTSAARSIAKSITGKAVHPKKHQHHNTEHVKMSVHESRLHNLAKAREAKKHKHNARGGSFLL